MKSSRSTFDNSTARDEVTVASIHAELVLYAAMLTQVERTRIASGNTLSAYTRDGLGPLVEEIEIATKHLQVLEHSVVDKLEKTMKQHYLYPWVKATNGLGLKQVGRLLGECCELQELNNYRQLWVYCGMGVVEGKAATMTNQKHNRKAKTRIHLIAESCMKSTKSIYRTIYDQERERWAELPKGHAHNRALRRMSKQILKDMWKEAKYGGELST